MTARRCGNAGKLRACGVAGIVFANSFTPRELTSLKLWYRADLGITTSGGVVTTWAEQSGAGSSHNYTAATTARPTYNATDATFNNRPTLTFDGVANFLSVSAGTILASGVSAFFAYKPDVANTNLTLFSDLGDVAGSSLMWQTSAGYQAVDEAGHSSNKTVTISTAPHVLGIDAASGAQHYWLDDATTSKNSDTQTWGTFEVTQFGARNGTAFFQGRAAEIVVCSGALSATQRKQLMRYMGAMYGRAVA